MDREILVCEVCGTTINVSMQIDLYAYDIHGDDTLHALCDYCAEQIAQDI